MAGMKEILKRTFAYDLLVRWRLSRSSKNMLAWSENDDLLAAFYSQFVAPGCLCFDIGANLGNRTKVFAKLGAKVIACEPQEQCLTLLTKAYRGNDKVVLVPKAVGAKLGEGQILLSNAHTLASLSAEWVQSVKGSGRFRDFIWRKKQPVEITTLDELISQYGTPAFIKIDVEGYEYEVVKGLSRPVGALSLEFVPEWFHVAENCLNHLEGLGSIVVNYSSELRPGGKGCLDLEQWVTPSEMLAFLGKLKGTLDTGDIYVRFEGAK